MRIRSNWNSHIAGGNAKWYSPSENSLVVSYRVKHMVTIISPTVICPRGVKTEVHMKICTRSLDSMLILISAMISSGKNGFNPRENLLAFAQCSQEIGLSCLQAEGLWGLKRGEQPGPDPGRVGFLRLGVQRAESV